MKQKVYSQVNAIKKNTSSFLWIYGIHPVRAALLNPQREIHQILTTENALKRLSLNNISKKFIKMMEMVDKPKIDAIVGPDKVHQGIILRAKPLRTSSLDEIISLSNNKEQSVIILLDKITDPYNIGAITRSAFGFGALAVILGKDGSPDETGALAKAASGALEFIPIVRVTNLNRAINKLQKNGFWSTGLETEAKTNIYNEDLPNKCLFILGSEGRGIRQLVKKNCDTVVKLPITKELESLNVSNAATIALFEWHRQMKKR